MEEEKASLIKINTRSSHYRSISTCLGNMGDKNIRRNVNKPVRYRDNIADTGQQRPTNMVGSSVVKTMQVRR